MPRPRLEQRTITAIAGQRVAMALQGTQPQLHLLANGMRDGEEAEEERAGDGGPRGEKETVGFIAADVIRCV